MQEIFSQERILELRILRCAREGNHIADITHPADMELTQRAIDQILAGENEPVRFIKRFIHKNGAVIWTDLNSSLRRDKDGNPLYLMTVMVDITERKQAESQKESALEEIRKLNENLGKMVDDRTVKLQETVAQLERLNRVFVDRELKMVELKEQITELEKRTS